MATKARVAVGVVVIVVGVVLALFFSDEEFLWFRGEPLGLGLVTLGVLDVGEALWKGRSRPAD